jgi:molybdate transport system substrate-binding protein
MGRRAGKRLAALAVVGALGLAAAACGDGGGDGGRSGATATGATGPGGEVEGTVTVLAASSLTDAFDDIADGFEAAHPGTTLEVSYGGSSALRDQVLSGQPADVLASASGSVADELVEAGATDGAPQEFATNRLEVVVPAGPPPRLEGHADLGDDGKLVGLCAEEVPCGSFGRQALANAGVTPAPDTNEPDVRSLLDKVAAGELDAGLVYVTDVASAGSAVEGIEVPDDVNVVAEYPIVALADAPNPDGAAAFVDYVLSDEGQAVLANHGFGTDGA